MNIPPTIIVITSLLIITKHPIANAQDIDCCDKRCRKEWSTLSQDEKNLYINGFKTLADQGVIQDLSQTHFDDADHGNEYFLPWHRGFIMIVEDAIRALGGDYECFAMPYWDWSNEPTPYEVANGETLVIMNSGIGDDSNGACQNSGSLFDENEYMPQSPDYVNSAGTRCLIRDMDYTLNADAGIGFCWFATPKEIMDFIGDTPTYNLFAGIEFEAGFHGWPHICISGNMGTFYSPDDPAFYLHHTFIDYIWALWQNCRNLENRKGPRAFNGILTRDLLYTPYTTDTYTTEDLLDISDYDIIYDQGPLFSNVVVTAKSNCPSTINSNWFTSITSSSRRRLARNGTNDGDRRRNSNKRKRVKFKPFRKSQKYLQKLLGQADELEIEVEVCANGREGCPVPDYFENCTAMTDDEVNALTIKDIISMEGINGCQVATREQQYEFAKTFGYLRQLCNGCMDPVCDHSIYYDKCSVGDNDDGANAQSVDIINNLVNPDQEIPSNPANPDSGYYRIEIEIYVLMGICVFTLINLMFCIIYCFKSKRNKGYTKVIVNQDHDSDVEDK